MKWVKTHCARMDHGGCALMVGVEDNRIVKIQGDPNGYLNRGYVCKKGLASPEKLSHPDRLKHPLKRTGKRGEGRFEKISWPEAIETIRRNFDRIREKDGARGVAFVQGMPKGMEHFVLIRLANFFGSPNVVAVQDVCHAPREISGFHTCGFYPVMDFHQRSKTIVLWGSNLTSTNEEGEIASLLLGQVKEGTKLIVIDPRKTRLAKKSAKWLQIKPGTDNELALAWLHVVIEEELFDKEFVAKWTYGFDALREHVKGFSPESVAESTWIDPDLIREAARLYACSKPSGIQWGNAIEQNPNNFDTARALVSLMAICGNLDVPGGNIRANEPRILSLGKFVRADVLPSKPKEMLHASHYTIPKLMTVPPAYFKKAVLEEDPYPVRGAYIQCANPMLSYADSRSTQAVMEKLEFTAVSDVFMTPTALFADVVLPAATHFEMNDIGHYGLGHGYILARPKMVDPPEDCWPDMKIINELGKVLTPRDCWPDDYEELLELLLKPSGLNFEEFCEKGYLKGEESFKKYESEGFKTATGKVELFLSKSELLGVTPLPGLGVQSEKQGEYPLVLTSAKNKFYLHSSYRWVEKLRKESMNPVVEIHPKTAAQYDICDGGQVRISTKHGEIIQIARLTEDIHAKVVNAAYGWWFPEAGMDFQFEWKKANYNMLTSANELGKEFGTPNLKGLACRIEKVQ